MIHLRGGSTMNTMGASLNKYFVQSRRLEVESVDKEVWDNITSQKGGQTVRDAKGVKEQHLDDKGAVVRNRNKTVGQIVEEEAAVQLAPSMGTLEQLQILLCIGVICPDPEHSVPRDVISIPVLLSPEPANSSKTE